VDWNPLGNAGLGAGNAQINVQNVNWLDPGFPLPVVPLAQNVVLLKAQYGIDTDGNNLLDCWTGADNNNTCGNGVDYSGPPSPYDANDPAGLGTFAAGLVNSVASRARVRSVKAVRVAIVVRSEHQERTGDAFSADLVGQTATLFNCAANNATCQGRIQIDNTVLKDYNRYRIYETVIPLRNSIWNQS
jgi:hypothetical protein